MRGNRYHRTGRPVPSFCRSEISQRQSFRRSRRNDFTRKANQASEGRKAMASRK
ncbi:UNVERIFIED_CONTAM: hypothetical protein GTU68_046600 [Idotea baltica]|nr:hypothetical protein [Idotea baltica]